MNVRRKKTVQKKDLSTLINNSQEEKNFFCSAKSWLEKRDAAVKKSVSGEEDTCVGREKRWHLFCLTAFYFLWYSWEKRISLLLFLPMFVASQILFVLRSIATAGRIHMAERIPISWRKICPLQGTYSHQWKWNFIDKDISDGSTRNNSTLLRPHFNCIRDIFSFPPRPKKCGKSKWACRPKLQSLQHTKKAAKADNNEGIKGRHQPAFFQVISFLLERLTRDENSGWTGKKKRENFLYLKLLFYRQSLTRASKRHARLFFARRKLTFAIWPKQKVLTRDWEKNWPEKCLKKCTDVQCQK